MSCPLRLFGISGTVKILLRKAAFRCTVCSSLHVGSTIFRICSVPPVTSLSSGVTGGAAAQLLLLFKQHAGLLMSSNRLLLPWVPSGVLHWRVLDLPMEVVNVS